MSIKTKLSSRTAILQAIMLIFAACSLSPTAQAEHNHAKSKNTPAYHKEFKNAMHWSKSFDDPERDKWQFPERVIEDLAVKDGDKIADIGAGTGYFAIRIAQTHKKATVLACDTEPDMIEFLTKEAKKRDLSNLTPVKISADKPEFGEKVNTVLIVDTLHHIDQRVSYIQQLSKALVSSGKIAVIDFKADSNIGPPAKYRIPEAELISQFKSAGFQLSEEFNYLPNQYFVIFEKSTAKSPES